MAHKTDEELIGKSHNTARYFTENRQVAWVLLVATLVAGTFGYLPEGAQPIDFKKDLGDNAALMLTVASPRISGSEIAIRAQAIEVSVRAARSAARAGARRTVVFNFPGALNPLPIARIVDQLAGFARAEGAEDIRPVRGNGFVAFDALSDLDREGWLAVVHRFESERLHGGW